MFSVIWWNILKNDRRQFVQMKIKDITSGRIKELKESGDTRFEILDKEERNLSYSYRDGAIEIFFTEEGEEIQCPAAGAEDALTWGVDDYVGFFVNDALVSVSPPRFVVCEIVETPPPMKNAGTGQKEAKLINGKTIKVNNVIQVGDKVRVETETMEFKERV